MKELKPEIKHISEPKTLADMTPEEIEALEAGTAIAVPVRSPDFSGRWYAVVAALAISMALLPLFVELSVIAFSLGYVAVLYWATVFKLQSNFLAELRTSFDIELGMQRSVNRMLLEHVTKHGLMFDEDEGTFVADDGLSKDDDGSESVH